MHGGPLSRYMTPPCDCKRQAFKYHRATGWGVSADDLAHTSGSHPPASDVSADTPQSFDLAIREWRAVGLPSFVALMEAFHDADLIQDPTMRAVVFKVVAGYIFRATNEYDGDMMLAHVAALSHVMSDPTVSRLVEGMIESQVDGFVGGLLNE